MEFGLDGVVLCLIVELCDAREGWQSPLTTPLGIDLLLLAMD